MIKRKMFNPLRHTFLGLILVALTAHAGGGRNRVVGSEMTVSPARGAVIVDGDLGDWDESRGKLLTLFVGGGEDATAPAPLSVYYAKIAFQYDAANLYVAVWWHDPTPLGSQTTAGMTPPGDGLILSLPDFRQANLIRHVALWQGRHLLLKTNRAVLAVGGQPWQDGSPVTGAIQGFKVTGKDSYTQEVCLPWAALGGGPLPGVPLRTGVELCFGDLDPAAGYKAWLRDVAAGNMNDANRWGGMMGWGFVDGIRTQEIERPGFDPAAGAEVKLLPAGTTAPPNPPMLFMGNEQTRTTGLIAVPAPSTGSGQGGKITVDGRFTAGEWPEASGTTIASEPTLFPGRYATTVHWAYAADGLYVGLRWHTGGPHLNINRPATVGRGYDGGDALQIRLGTDRVTHIDAWYYDADKQPAMNLGYGVKFNEGSVPDALAKGAKLAISELSGGGPSTGSGQGYTEELFLPWSLITLTGKALGEGDRFRVIFDLFYSGLEGNRIPFVINTKYLPPTGVVVLPFTAPADGFYTLVIEDAAGTVVRRLLSHVKIGKGQQVAEWDGLDDSGKPVPAGDYRFRGLHHAGLGLKYLTTYNNPGIPPWQDDDGTGEWGGDHAPPQTVAADDWGIYLGWPSAEDGNGFIGCDFDGRKRWGFFQTPAPAAAGGSALLASDGQFLYFANEAMDRPQKGQNELAYFQAVVTCLDRTTGRRAGFSTAKAFHEIARHDTSQVAVNWYWDLWQKKDFSLDTYALHDDYYFSGHCAGGNLVGLAARAGKLYVSLRVSGEVVVYSSVDMKELARWKVTKPGGLAFAPDGTLYAVSDKAVVKLDLATGTATPVITRELEAPVALAVDRDGAIYVSDWGKAQCVKVFSPTGNLQRTVGKPGGRPWIGKYDPEGMLLPRGLAIDKNGKLWVTEDDNFPRRVSVWVAESNMFLKEFVGGTIYGAVNGGMIDPKNPTRAISGGVWFGLDLAKEGSRPLWTMWRKTLRDECFGFGPSIGANAAPGTRFIDFANRRFIVSADSGRVVIGELRPDGSWQPLAAVGGIFKRGDNPAAIPDEKLTWRMERPPAFFPAHAGQNYIWTDGNGDGAAQENEFQWRVQDRQTFPNWGAYWGVGMVDSKMNVVLGGEPVIARFPLQGWTEQGVPKYDIQKCEIAAKTKEGFSAVAVDRNGNVFTVLPGEAKHWGNKETGIFCYGPDGKPRWMLPTDEDFRPMGNFNGESLMGPVDAGGETGEIIALTQWHGGHVPLITTDGLFIDRLLRDPAEGGAPGPDMYRGETIQYLNRLDDGRVILSHGKNAHHLMQVTGLDTVQRFNGNFSLSAGAAQQAVARLRNAQEQLEQRAPIRIAHRKDPVTVDGKLEDWDWTTAVGIGPKAGQPRAEVALSTDGKALFAAFKVFKGKPFLNVGQEVTQLFLTGDAADLQLCLDPAAAPDRPAAKMGDCRLLFSKLGERPVAVFYRVQVPGAKAPVAFRSPAREVLFDEVSEIKTAKVVIADTADGYIVEAAVPIAALGIPEWPGLWPGRVIPGDAGIIVADATGRRVARLYRFNADTQVVNDVPTEAVLTPAKWGEIEVAK